MIEQATAPFQGLLCRSSVTYLRSEQSRPVFKSSPLSKQNETGQAERDVILQSKGRDQSKVSWAGKTLITICKSRLNLSCTRCSFKVLIYETCSPSENGQGFPAAAGLQNSTPTCAFVPQVLQHLAQPTSPALPLLNLKQPKCERN